MPFVFNDDDLNFGSSMKPYSPRLATKEGCQVITEHWLPYEITTSLTRPRTTWGQQGDDQKGRTRSQPKFKHALKVTPYWLVKISIDRWRSWFSGRDPSGIQERLEGGIMIWSFELFGMFSNLTDFFCRLSNSMRNDAQSPVDEAWKPQTHRVSFYLLSPLVTPCHPLTSSLNIILTLQSLFLFI